MPKETGQDLARTLILQLLNEHDWSQEQLAAYLGIKGQSSISDAKTGRRPVGPIVIKALARKFPEHKDDLLEIGPSEPSVKPSARAPKSVAHTREEREAALLRMHPELREVWGMRCQAIEAYLALNEGANRATVSHEFDLVFLGHFTGELHGAKYWLDLFDSTVKKRDELYRTIQPEPPDEH